MNRAIAVPRVLLAAGGTGGHLFPAEALAQALLLHGIEADLATDERATRFGSFFPEHRVHVIASETIRGRNPAALWRAGSRLGIGFGQAYRLLGALRPAAVIGFGGYPTLPPLLAAYARGIPTVLHEANGVMGRANRLLARFVRTIATGFPGVIKDNAPRGGRVEVTGNPLRQAVIEAAATPFTAPEPGRSFKLLVFGGSQGARVFSEVLPAAVDQMQPADRTRLLLVQQAREEDVEGLSARYRERGIQAVVAPFFRDLPARIAGAHLVVSRAGAMTVSELAAIGRPSILVPLPHALDQDQSANAGVLSKAGGAIRLAQSELTPERLATEIGSLMGEPSRLIGMASAARMVGVPDAAERLAALVLRVAALESGRKAA